MNLVLGDVEETITVVDIDEDTGEGLFRVSTYSYLNNTFFFLFLCCLFYC